MEFAEGLTEEGKRLLNRQRRVRVRQKSVKSLIHPPDGLQSGLADIAAVKLLSVPGRHSETQPQRKLSRPGIVGSIRRRLPALRPRPTRCIVYRPSLCRSRGFARSPLSDAVQDSEVGVVDAFFFEGAVDASRANNIRCSPGSTMPRSEQDLFFAFQATSSVNLGISARWLAEKAVKATTVEWIYTFASPVVGGAPSYTPEEFVKDFIFGICSHPKRAKANQIGCLWPFGRGESIRVFQDSRTMNGDAVDPLFLIDCYR